MRLRPMFLIRDLLRHLGAALVIALVSPQVRGQTTPADAPLQWTHAHAAFGQPKYPPGFAHFDYVNPDAPKGGTINLRNPDRRSSFDKFNPFTVKGNAPAGMSIFMFESLAILGSDELQTMYGLLAEAIAVAPDKSSISFRLNPKARFSNGDPVTAADVQYSFESMSGKYASPGLRAALAGVERVVVVDERTVRFDLRERTNDMLFSRARRHPRVAEDQRHRLAYLLHRQWLG